MIIIHLSDFLIASMSKYIDASCLKFDQLNFHFVQSRYDSNGLK